MCVRVRARVYAGVRVVHVFACKHKCLGAYVCVIVCACARTSVCDCSVCVWCVFVCMRKCVLGCMCVSGCDNNNIIIIYNL